MQGLGTDPNGTTHSAPVTLQVVDLILSTPSPSSITEPRGAVSPAVSFQVTAEGTFNESVTLACSFTPNITGASCAFNPASVIFPTSDLPTNMSVTVTVPATTILGPYNVTIQATASGQTSPVTQSFTMNVTLNPTFILSEPSGTSFPNVNAGSTGTSGPITVSSQDGFSGTVNLSCLATLNISCSISPTSVTTFPSTVTLVINSSGLTAGTYQVTVQGVSGSITNSLIVPFVLVDYAIAGPFTLTTIPGGSVTGNYLFTEVDGYTGQIDLSCNASPLLGAQCALNPPGPITLGVEDVQVVASIAVPSNATADTYTITINSHDTSGAPSHSFPISLAVQDFALSAIAPSSQSVGVGETATYSFNVAPVGASFSGQVTLACSGAPSGSTCTVTPNSVTPGNSPTSVAMTIMTTSSTPQGPGTISVTGTSGSLVHLTTASLKVADTLQLTLKQGFPSGAADPGVQLNASVLLTPNYVGTVTATCTSSLAAAQCTLLPPNNATPGNIPINGSALTIPVVLNIPNSTAIGGYTATVTVQDAATETPTQSIVLPFNVGQDYTISIAPGQQSQSITAGQSITYNLTVQPVGASYTNAVTLTCTSPQLPGSCNSFSPNPVPPFTGPQSVVMTVTTTASSSGLLPQSPPNVPWLYAAWCSLAMALACSRIISKARSARLTSLPQVALLTLALALLFFLPSCGSGSNGSSPAITTGTPVTFTLTVTGSPASSSQPAGASMSLIVN